MNDFLSNRARSARYFLPGLMLILLVGCSGDPDAQGQGGMPPTPVTLAQVNVQDVTQYGQYSARIQGVREVEIRARVGGILQARHFVEGETVDAGQTLFQIEPESYELLVLSAEAELADARANQSQAQRDWQRVSGLYERQAVSQRDRDQALAAREAAEARFIRAQSSLNDAQRSLRYARVEAPVDGMAGMEVVTEGNLVNPGDLLTHISQQDEVRVYFSLPERDAIALRQWRREGGDDRSAQLLLADRSTYSHEGEIDFTDNRILVSTGSVNMRAQFSNPDGELVPGQFVRVRIPIRAFTDVFLIDQTAVSQGPEGPQVFIVSTDNTAQAKPVSLGPVIDSQQVILDGLSAGDRLVVNGHVALRDGASVQVTDTLDKES